MTSIRAFVEVAEPRAVSRAARELHLAQPAVTRRVQRLESSLGVALATGAGGPSPSPRRGRPSSIAAAACSPPCARCGSESDATADLALIDRLAGRRRLRVTAL